MGGLERKTVVRERPDIDTDALAEFVPGIVTVQRVSYVNPETARRNTVSYPDQDNKGQVAAALALKMVELGPVLIFCSSPRNANGAAKALVERLKSADSPERSLQVRCRSIEIGSPR